MSEERQEDPLAISALLTRPRLFVAALAIILIIGAYFRFTGINWDDDQHLHPDERFMTIVAEQIQPDAIILDLMMEHVDSGSNVARQLGQEGYKGPIYLLSSAGESVRFNLDARDLGITGIFQKPIAPAILVDMLKTNLLE